MLLDKTFWFIIYDLYSICLSTYFKKQWIYTNMHSKFLLIFYLFFLFTFLTKSISAIFSSFIRSLFTEKNSFRTVRNSGSKACRKCGPDPAKPGQVRNTKPDIPWDEQFHHINRTSATTASASILAHMRWMMCTLHQAERVYDKSGGR